MPKKNIHPKYYLTTVTDIQGNTFQFYSTIEHMRVEESYLTHPYYTGKQKTYSSASRVQRFEEKRKKMEELQKKKSDA